MIGTSLAHYRLTAKIGQGGMGEVYRAVDTTLGREVAIKLLPPDAVDAPERLIRLRREAKLLAALNHPNIAAIYGLHEADGRLFLVLELAEGEDLAQRLKRGALSMEMAISIGRQIAHALEEAHEKGIVHRDLKPANIKLSRGGKIKVLDFGLAKAYGGDLDLPRDEALSQAATMSSEYTGSGLILGTAAYMSPEQARGLPVDKRTDIWAFGVVVFEMVTGRRLFTGVTLADTLASVLTSEIPWNSLPEEMTAAQRRLLRRCLDRDRGRRLRDIGEVRIALDGLATGEVQPPPAAFSERWRSRAWIALGLLSVAVALGGLSLRPAEGTLRPFRLKAAVGADASLALRSGLSLSSDGTTLAFVSEPPGGPAQLYVRKLDQLAATPLADTQDASDPFFSPDGQWIGFFADRKLKKVPSQGGAVITLCDAPAARGGTWAARDLIVFGVSGRGTHLQKVSAQGGRPTPLGTLAPDEAAQAWPQALPDGKTVLYTSHRAGAGTFEAADLMATSLDGARPVLVTRGAFFGRYMEGGHVLFVRSGQLLAAPFDLGRLSLQGEPVSIADDLANDADAGSAQYALSPAGTLVYVQRRPPANAQRPVFWMDDLGRTAPLRQAPSDWTTLRFAPGGKMLAFAVREGAQYDIWTYEWRRDVMTKVTFDQSNELHPVWTPGGGAIVYAASREPGVSNIFFQRLDRTGTPQRLTEAANPQLPYSFHPSGDFLAYTERNPNSKEDILILRIEGEGASGLEASKSTVFLSTNASEERPMFSPDGRWIAYNSNESGRHEVYVRAFPGPGGPWKISTNGGASPQWSRTMPEIFYAEIGPTETRIMVAPFVVEGSTFRPGAPVPWSPRGFAVDEDFELHPDGRRLATGPTERSAAPPTDQVVILLDIRADLKRLAPPARSP